MRRRLSLAIVLLVAAFSVAGGLASAGPAAAGPATTPPKTITRDLLTDGITKTVVDSRIVSLSVDETANLRGLQQVRVSWTGAHPTGGSGVDPNSAQAATLEYPMVLLECRGVDSPGAPAAQQLSPETCWTSSPSERWSGDTGTDYGFPPWRVDLYASPAQRVANVGVDPQHPPGNCSPYLSDIVAQYWLHFAAANGTDYPGGPNGCGGQPPEAVQTIGNPTFTFPSNETFAVTAPDGTGSSKFLIQTSDQNASLGCSETVACSLVAVPVMGMSCDVAALGLPPEDRAPTSTLSDPTDPTSPLVYPAAQAEADCTAPGHLVPGAFGNGGDAAVDGIYWWAASNWRNRITVPLNFAPVGDPCSTTGKNGGVEIYGSELMTEATSQWDPHFCTNDQLFTLKHVQIGEPLARNLLEQNLLNLKSPGDKVPPGNVEAAYATYAPTDTYSTPVVKAPVALTGFAIAFAMDDAQRHEITSLNLDARLLAKLLTESYPSSLSLLNNWSATVGGTTSTVLQHNPQTLAQDPEFHALNPNANLPGSTPYLSAAATLYALSSGSDVMYALTSYIINDPEARAWLAGAPDPWGMRVNPHYAIGSNEISLPTFSWPLLDQAPDSHNTNFTAAHCSDFASVPYLPLVAAPASSLAKIALATQFSDPLSTTDCVDLSGGLPNPIFRLARVPREAPGLRFMLGVVSLGEASRYQLNTASLQTQMKPGTPTNTVVSPAGRTFVAPTDTSLKAAAKLLVPVTSTGTWEIPPDAIATMPEGANAYPGTMLVSAQVPTLGLPSIDASRYAQFLRFAAGDGQTPGTAAGQLPPGYLPLTAANGLGSLAHYTKVAADEVEDQTGVVPPLIPRPGS